MQLEYTFYIGASPEEVWDVLFNPEKSYRAFMGGVIQSNLQAGDPIRFGEILAYEKYRVLSYTDHPGPSHFAEHETMQSRVTIRLEPVGTCTKLHLINDQWTDSNPLFLKTEKFWWMILSNIKSIAETGSSLDFGF
ncbi:hypothetical protein BGX30_015213 [Mortierella sp. GBA39]|nr:hypothetical protein BGX30_015213 [Mortierella sp. GBA39]